MSRWVVDLWADDDEGLTRMREALALVPPEPPPPPPSRRDLIAELTNRVRAGDTGAAEELSQLLDVPPRAET